MKEQNRMQPSNEETTGERDGVRFAAIASAKARGESVSPNDEALYQASLISAENVAEAEFWSKLVAYAESEELSSDDATNDQVLVDRILARHQQQSRVRMQRKWLFRGSALAVSAAALWMIFLVESKTSMWIVRSGDTTEELEHAAMSSNRSKHRGEARLRVREKRSTGDQDTDTDSLRFSNSRGVTDDALPPIQGDQGTVEASQISNQRDVPEQARDAIDSASSKTSLGKDGRKYSVSAEQMLIRAQQHLAHGNRRRAWHGYRNLLRRYPNSSEAKVSLISLGRIGLQLGYTNRALKYFNRYLRQGHSDLLEEALVGRIEALAKLGNKSREMNAIHDFMEKAPKSAYRQKLQLRLDQLQTNVE